MDGTAAGRFQRAALGPRTLTAVVGIPLLLGALWAGGVWWIAVAVLVGILGRREFAALQALSVGQQAATILLLLVGWVVFQLAQDLRFALVMLLWSATTVAVVLWHFATMASGRRLPGILAALYVPIYLSAPTALLMRWRDEHTPWSILAFLLVIWANDTAAYFVGIAAGRHKLAPRISPGKSWEGAAGGATAGGLVGLAAAPWLGMTPVAGAIFGVLATMVSQVGDLLESAMKRRAGVKDSGTILPGHGGILDRFDGIFLAAPVAYVLVRVWGGR